MIGAVITAVVEMVATSSRTTEELVTHLKGLEEALAGDTRLMKSIMKTYMSKISVVQSQQIPSIRDAWSRVFQEVTDKSLRKRSRLTTKKSKLMSLRSAARMMPSKVNNQGEKESKSIKSLNIKLPI